MPFEITKEELKSRVGYILLGFFTFYIVEPIRDLVSKYVPINPIIIGIVGLLITLYLFDFK